MFEHVGFCSGDPLHSECLRAVEIADPDNFVESSRLTRVADLFEGMPHRPFVDDAVEMAILRRRALLAHLAYDADSGDPGPDFGRDEHFSFSRTWRARCECAPAVFGMSC
jgi:hypothetical protein